MHDGDRSLTGPAAAPLPKPAGWFVVVLLATLVLQPHAGNADGALAVGLPGDVAKQGVAIGYALNYNAKEAAQAEDTTFERDGVTYSYTTSVENGRTVITGKTNGAVPFRLVVRGERVTGQYNGSPVEFSLRDVKREAAAAALAVR